MNCPHMASEFNGRHTNSSSDVGCSENYDIWCRLQLVKLGQQSIHYLRRYIMCQTTNRYAALSRKHICSLTKEILTGFNFGE